MRIWASWRAPGFEAESGWDSSANVNISRYDMAQLMTNIMSAKGFTATDSQKSLARYDITDYGSIPSQYRDAVENVFALKIINGYGDGSFSGSGTMTRGAGAKVINSMMSYTPAADTGTTAQPEPPETPSTPETPPTGTSDIAVSSSMNGDDTMWTVSDNGYATGYLNNGKTITEQNVMDLIAAAKTQWPQGMDWQDNAYTATNTFNTKNAIQTEKAVSQYKQRQDGGCVGFAAMINNYVFGQTNNPIRKLTDNTQTRPGDIIILIDKSTNTVRHVAIATSYTTSKSTGKTLVSYSDGGGFISDGYGIINWDKNVMSPTQLANGNSATRYEVWTRYPD